MIVGGKYELLQVIREGAVRTHRAKHIALGQIVLVHFIQEALAGDAFALLTKLSLLPESARRQFIDAGEHNSAPYVVSWELAGFDDLSSWLDRAIAKAGAKEAETQPAAAPPAAAPVERKLPGEFTRLFFTGVATDPGMQQPAPVAKETPPGEFTRFFGGAASPVPAADPPMAQAGAALPQPKPSSDPPEIVHRVVVFPSPTVDRPAAAKTGKADWLEADGPESRPAPPETFQPAGQRRAAGPTGASWADDALPPAAGNSRPAIADARPDWAEDALPAGPGTRAADQVPLTAEAGGYTQVVMHRPSPAPPSETSPAPPSETSPAPPSETPPAPAPPQRAPAVDLRTLWVWLAVLGAIAIALVLFFALRG